MAAALALFLSAAPAVAAGAVASVSLLGEVQPLWLLIAGALVAVGLFVPILLLVRGRMATLAARQDDLKGEAARLEEVLTIAPDGYYAWHIRRGARQPVEICSRRLAVTLGLVEGTSSTFSQVLSRFKPASATALEEAVVRLRADGTPFSIALVLEDRDRDVSAMGNRAATDQGEPLADTVWMRDVSDTSQAIAAADHEAAQMRSARDRLIALIDALPVPIWLRDDSLALTFCNLAYSTAVEAETPDDAVHQGLELVQGAAARQARALAALARAAGEARTETTHIVIGGERRPVAVTEIPVGLCSDNPDGERRCTAGIAIDMTRVDEVEGELSRLLAAQATVLEKLATAIAIFDADTRLSFCNTAFVRLWRLEGDWPDGRPGYAAFIETLRERRRLPEVADFPAFRRQELGHFTSLLDQTEDLLHIPDGTTLRRVLSPHPLGGLLCTYEDVTDRLALERSYNTLIAVQRETLDHLTEAVAVFGADGRLRLFNPAYAALWGHEADDLASEPRLADLLEGYRPFFADVEDWPAFKAQIKGLLTDRTPRQGRIARSDGSILSYASFPLPDGGELLTYHDITDSARVERALVERNDALKAANRLRSQFVANVSGEVGAPLAELADGADNLAGGQFGPLNTEQKEAAERIAAAAHGLIGVIEHVVDLASLEAGERALELDAFDIHALVDGVRALVHERVRVQSILLGIDCRADIGWMVGDERRIKQALFTLVGNAVRFTPAGGQVTLSARREAGMVCFSVADTGIGIPEAELQRLMAGEKATFHGKSPGDDGGGLGLALIKSFIEMHGGTIQIASPPGKGTMVTCRLPTGTEPDA